MLTFVSLFSGAGGFEIGFEQAGFKCIASSDFDSDSAKTHALNWPDTPFIHKDIATLLPSEILKQTKGKKNIYFVYLLSLKKNKLNILKAVEVKCNE